MEKSLIIGYGNSLRSDDGAGFRVGEMVELWQLPQVRSLSVQQLTPELAEIMAEVSQIIFVDAAISLSEVQLQSIEIGDLQADLGHISNPRSLLALTQVLYKVCPTVWQVLIPGENFEFGETFSPLTQQGITEALALIKLLI